MIVLYVAAGVAVALLVSCVTLRIVAMLAMERMLERYDEWKADHPDPTREGVREYFHRTYNA